MKNYVGSNLDIRKQPLPNAEDMASKWLNGSVELPDEAKVWLKELKSTRLPEIGILILYAQIECGAESMIPGNRYEQTPRNVKDKIRNIRNGIVSEKVRATVEEHSKIMEETFDVIDTAPSAKGFNGADYIPGKALVRRAGADDGKVSPPVSVPDLWNRASEEDTQRVAGTSPTSEKADASTVVVAGFVAETKRSFCEEVVEPVLSDAVRKIRTRLTPPSRDR